MAIASPPEITVPISEVEPTPTTFLEALEGFRSGIWTDMHGREDEYTVEQLMEAAESYNEVRKAGIYSAPILINHSQAYGKKGDLKPTARVEGDRLILDGEKVPLEFAADVKGGVWTDRSIGLFHPSDPHNPTKGRWNIMELSFVPIPAVNGLRPPQFSGFMPGEGVYVTIPSDRPSPPDLTAEVSALKREIEALKFAMKPQTKEAEMTTEQQPTTDTQQPPATDHSAQFSAMNEAIASLRSEVDVLKGENATLKTANQELQDKAAAAQLKAEELEVTATVDGLVEQGLVTAEEKEGAIAFAMSLDNNPSPKFSVGGTELSQRAAYLKQLGDRKPAGRVYSAAPIEIEPSDRTVSTADITARRKSRSLPTAK